MGSNLTMLILATFFEMSIKDKCGRFVEILLEAKFLHSCRGSGSFSNPGGSNRVPPHFFYLRQERGNLKKEI